MIGNKSATATALLLMLTFAISLVAIPSTSAVVSTRKSYAVIGATPNPVGVGKETLILMGLTQQLQIAAHGWEGITVTVTKPDGTTQTLGPYRTDSTGLTGAVYVPAVVGNYTLQVNFPEQWYNYSGNEIKQLATTSEKVTLVVLEETPITYPTYPLPTEFWTRPIDSQLREWKSIAGNWLTTPRNFLAQGNDDAPESAHILWTRPLTSGGLAGGALNAIDGPDLTNVGYEHGDAYEGKWGGSFGGSPALIMGGKLYYTEYAAADAYKNQVCIDLHTGQQIWNRVLLDNLTLLRGQQHYWQTYDNQGVYDYLWTTANTASLPLLGLNSSAGTTWVAFDPYNGDYVYTLYGIPSGTFTYGPKGEMLLYNAPTSGGRTVGYMTLWNSTNIPALYAASAPSTPIQTAAGPVRNYSIVYLSMAWGQWRPMGKVVNATGPAYVTFDGKPMKPPTLPLGLNGYQWNVTIPAGLQGSVRAVFPGDKLVGAVVNQTHVNPWAISLKPGQEGTLLYSKTWNAPSEWLAGNLTVSFGAISNIDGVFTVNTKEDRWRYGFSVETGDYMWRISEPLAMLGHLTGGPSGENGYIAYGLLFSGTMSGVIQAFNVTNGQLVWKYEVKDPYQQVLWSNNYPVGHLIAADGKIYIANLEHSVNMPLPRGGPLIALDVKTGEVVFRADGLFRQTVWGGRAIIGDSIIATMDTYDQRIYGIGKGPSATTVTVKNDVITQGNAVVIQGTVTDVSPGTEGYSLKARFPNGVPAVSDESMSDWMRYVYKQFPRPTNATGVEVTLSVLDANNNFREIGKTTADSDGFYSLMWTPDIPGKFTVYANFAGSKSYWPSHATAAFGVMEAPEPAATPEPEPQPPTELYFTISTVAIIAAIAVVGAILALILRKR